MKLMTEQYEILDHTLNRAAKNRYCGNSPEMQQLVEAGLMESSGKVPWCPEEYFRITEAGISALFQANTELSKQNPTETLVFVGIDTWNRPVFKSKERPNRFYGSTEGLFKYGATEKEVNEWGLTEKYLCYFGRSFGCEPDGRPCENIKIEWTEGL